MISCSTPPLTASLNRLHSYYSVYIYTKEIWIDGYKNGPLFQNTVEAR